MAARIGVMAAPAMWGLIAGWWTPRGPISTGEVLAAMAISTLVGASVGLLFQSRWAILVAPLVFVVVFELVRLGADGPTVDGPRFSTYGLIALIVGRGFHGAVAVAPMMLGAVGGVAMARTAADRSAAAANRRPTGWVRRGFTGVAVLGMVALAALVARPASTGPVLGTDGEPLAGSIAELTTVRHEGREYGLMVRGASTDAPVLLFLAGGPGGAERGAMRKHLGALEEHFVVATWDQRGSGASYGQLDPTDTVTLDGYVADTIAVTEHLRTRFSQDRIYLLGQSWGSTLGVLAVQERPELYRAFIGTGQMVSQLATDTIFYEDTLAWADAHGQDALAAELRRIGPPPYDDMLDYETALSHEHDVYSYDHSGNAEGAGGFSESLFVREYTLTDQIHLLGAFMDTFAALYPQLQEIDFRDSATRLVVPAFFVQGAHEARGRAEPFDDWYRTLQAPDKDLVVLETSGHRPPFEQPDEFVEFMADVVLARTASGRR